MADTRIHDLTAGTAAATDEVVVTISPFAAGDDRRLTLAQLKTFNSASPTLVTPALGVATATTINGVTLTGTGTIASGGGIAAGVWTPTLANLVNIDGTPSSFGGQYIRVSNVVHCSFTCAIDPTTTLTTTSLTATLPIASNFASSTDAAGYGGFGNASPPSCATVTADTTNDVFAISFVPADVTNRVFTFIATYRII